MFRASRVLLALLLGVAPVTTACKTGSDLTKIEAPAEGVTLSYDLTPGQVYQGSVRYSETVREVDRSTSVTNSFNFDLTLRVRGADTERRGMGVTARFSNVQVRWSLPPGIPISLAEFNRDLSRRLQGLEVDLVVDDAGKILYVPDLPEDWSTETRVVVQRAIDALESAFLPVPDRAIKVGDAWKDDKTRGRKGKLGRYVEGSIKTRVDGFYTTGDPPLVVARLITDTEETEITTTASGAHEVKKQSTTEALFATEQRFLHRYVREQRIFDPGVSNTFAKTEVSWKKPPGPAPGAGEAQVQDISDPCHPDYVGAEECPDQPTPEDDAPADAPEAPAA